MERLDHLKPGDVLGQADLATYISAMGLGVAEAQRALDDNSVHQLGDFLDPQLGLEGKSLIQLGLMPAFYHFRSATLTCSVSMSLRVQETINAGGELGDRSSAAIAQLVTDCQAIKNAVEAMGAQSGYAELTGAGSALTTAMATVTALSADIPTAGGAITQIILDTLETDRAAIDAATAAMADLSGYADLATGATTYDAAKAATAAFKISLGSVKVKRASAVAYSLDARYSRMFDLSMSGNMSLAAELVSIPAPPEFLQFIKDYLE